MNDTMYAVAAIAVVTLVTVSLRALPFVMFAGRPLPKVMEYLSRVLPPAIMTVLVIYCLRNIDFVQMPHGLPELISCALVVALHLIRNNMYLSIVAGTACYMILIRIL